jgi:hypothetical protein
MLFVTRMKASTARIEMVHIQPSWLRVKVFYESWPLPRVRLVYFRSTDRPPPRTFFAVGKSSLAMGSTLVPGVSPGSSAALVSAPVVAKPDDDQLSDLASVQIRSHPRLAQIRSRSRAATVT